MRRSTLMFTMSNLLFSLLNMVRAILVAWLIPVADFGVASTYLMIVLFFDAITGLGLDRMIVQDRDGDSEEFQACLQAMQVVRGLAAGALMVAVAGPVAQFLGTPEAAAAYRMLALIPVLRGFAHFDQHRMKRTMDTRQASLIMSVSSIASIAIVFAAALFVRDHRIMLWSILGQQVIALALSHVLADRPYRLLWTRELSRRATRFGTPLMVNGLLLFVIFNGERVIVGRELGMAQLAIYTMMLNLVMTPMLVLVNVAQTVFLSSMTALRDQREELAATAQAAMQSGLAIGLVLTLGIVIAGTPVIAWLTGAKYQPGLPLLALLSICQTMRIAKSGPATVSLSYGRTGNFLMGNIFWALAMPIAWWRIANGGTLEELITIAIGAETLAVFVSTTLARRASQLPILPTVLPIFLAGLTLALVALDLHLYAPRADFAGHLHAFQLVLIVSGTGTIFSMRALVAFIRKHYLRS